MRNVGLMAGLVSLALVTGAYADGNWQIKSSKGVTSYAVPITSATTPANVPAIEVDQTKDAWVSLRATVIGSATITYLNNGVPVNSQAVAVGTTPSLIALPAPQYFDSIGISFTVISNTALASGTVILEN